MPKHKQRKEIILFILDVVLLVGALVLAMPVSIRWALWLTCWTVTVVLAQLHFEFPKRTKARVITTAIMVCLFMLAFSLLAYKRWVEEKATALNGELEVPATDRSDVVFQIGAAADGTKITWKGGNGPISNIVGSKLSIRREKGKLLLSVEVRERGTGAVVVSIIDNKWTVSSAHSVSWDHNYTSSALEVKDGRGRVVFQGLLTAEAAGIQGEWVA